MATKSRKSSAEVSLKTSTASLKTKSKKRKSNSSSNEGTDLLQALKDAAGITPDTEEKVNLLDIPVIKLSLNECKRLQRIQEVLRSLLADFDKKPKIAGRQEDARLIELRQLLKEEEKS